VPAQQEIELGGSPLKGEQGEEREHVEESTTRASAVGREPGAGRVRTFRTAGLSRPLALAHALGMKTPFLLSCAALLVSSCALLQPASHELVYVAEASGGA